MKKLLLLCIAFVTLPGCSSYSTLTLDQKLEKATNQADQKKTLRIACLNEAEWPTNQENIPMNPRYYMQGRMMAKEKPEIQAMKLVCTQMDDLTTMNRAKRTPEELASMCAIQVAEKKRKGKNWVEHAARIKHICEDMTGVSIK